jgi:tetratricopeptide (TPR) repeat protein
MGGWKCLSPATHTSQGDRQVPHPGKRPVPPSPENVFPPGSVLGFLAHRSQLDFEIEFFGKLLAILPAYAEVLWVQASNLTTKGRLQDGLAVDQQLVATRPADPTAHYNLACRYALLKQADMALRALRRAVELGYRDFQFMEEDRDLESIRKDPRFRQLVREFRSK